MSRLLKEMLVLGTAFVALIYLMLPTLGVFELAPDFLPIVGWLDEGVATLILANTLRYYGIDLTALYKRNDQDEDNPKAGRRRGRSDWRDNDEPFIIYDQDREYDERNN